MTATVTVTVNGEFRKLPTGTTVEALIREVTGSTRGAAAVIDGEVLPRSAWHDVVIQEAQTVELIMAVQGG